MRATPGLVSGTGIAAGLMFLLGRQRGKPHPPALPVAASLAAGAVAGARQAISRVDTPRRVTDLAEAARRLRPQWRNGRITLRRRRRVTFLRDHPWAVFGAAAGVLAAGMWGLRRREAGKIRIATTIQAPIERVFDAWSRFDDFPRFMPMVAEVRPTGEDRWHWVIAGPAGAPIEFDSIVTRRDRPRLIEWTSADDALVEPRGTARFRPTADDGTRVEITMSWRPVGGGLGEAVAFMSGVDPGHALREGLAGFKARLEGQAVAR